MDVFKETDFLYEVDKRCGLLTLTIDGNRPVYILFQHNIKIELSLKENTTVVKDENMIIQAPLDPGPAPFRKSLSLQSTGHNSIAESLLTQALNIQDIDKLIKDKLALTKEQKLERTIDRVKRKAVRSAVKKQSISHRATVVKQNHKTEKKVIVKQEPCDTPPVVNDKAESDCEMSEEEQIVTNAEPGQSNAIDCEYCFRTFNTRLEFFNHRRSKIESHQCKHCSKVFSFGAYLLAHMRKQHPSDGLPVANLDVCDVCGLKLKNFTRLKKHMLIHTKEYHYKCCLCGKNIGGFGALNTHMTSHKNAGMVKCTCCDQHFPSRSELSKHQLALLEIKCNLCGEVLPNRTSRTVHYQLAHPDSILSCHICSRLFSSDEELSSHMIYHTKYKKKQCTVCGKFVSRLERHILTHKAMKDVDESELYMCDKCPMKFKIKVSLQRHQRTHSQERPFKCSQCPKAFAHQGVLLKHLKTHSPILPYACEVCGKRCKEKSNLTVHMRIHSSSKAFPCHLCTQAFSYKSSLDGHLRSKHALLCPDLTKPAAESAGLIDEQPAEFLLPETEL